MSNLEQLVKEQQRLQYRKDTAALQLKDTAKGFVKNPANAVFPFVAGVIVTARQLHKKPGGKNKQLPVSTLIKLGIGSYSLLKKLNPWIGELLSKSRQNPTPVKPTQTEIAENQQRPAHTATSSRSAVPKE